MPSKNNSEESESKKVELRNLQSLLNKSINKELTVVKYETTNLLPDGENYASTILKVEAEVKKTKNSSKETLSLVAKMTPTLEFRKDIFNATASFKKEIYIFEKLLPIYRQLEKEAGIEDKDLIDILPKFYGGRLSLKEEIPSKADEDVTLLMENIHIFQT